MTYTLHHADSIELIKTMPTDSVDLLLTDPPYNYGKYSRGNIGRLRGRSTDLNNDIADWDKLTFQPEQWVSEFKRVVKPTGNIFIFAGHNQFGKWHACLDPIYDTFQFAVWHKTNPVVKIRKAGFLNSTELIVCAWNRGHTWNFKSQNEMHNHVESPICMGKERLKDPVHPTQKPVKVLEWIIERASNMGDMVFDPFMGVGSTGIACLNLGRKFVGVEIDTEYYEAASRRLISHEASQGMSLEKLLYHV